MSITAQLLYVSASGAKCMERKLEVISNNLANIDTTGFKREGVNFSTVYVPLTQPPPKNRKENPPVGYIATYNLSLSYAGTEEDFFYLEQGALRETGRKLDFAIEGKGFFVVENEKGKRFLTRDGAFHLDKEGYLRTSSGYYVIGKSGSRISLQDATNIYVTEEGTIFSNGMESDSFLIVTQPRATKLGNNLWEYDSNIAQEDVDSKVYQGFLEDSNVNPVYEMVKMIEAHRVFDANLNAIKAGDEVLAVLNDFGGV